MSNYSICSWSSGEGESPSRFARLSHTYHLPCRRLRLRRADNHDDHEEPPRTLSGESLSFFPHLYHAYHFAFRSVSVHTQLFGQFQVTFLTRLANRYAYSPLYTHHLLEYHCCRRPIRYLGVGEYPKRDLSQLS